MDNLPLYVSIHHLKIDFYPTSFNALDKLARNLIQKIQNLKLDKIKELFKHRSNFNKLKFGSNDKTNINILSYYILDEIIRQANQERLKKNSCLISSEHIYNAVFLDKDFRLILWDVINTEIEQVIDIEEIKYLGQDEFSDYQVLTLIINYIYQKNKYQEFLQTVQVGEEYSDIKTELIIKILVIIKESINYVQELASSDMIIQHILYNNYFDLKSLL